MKAEQLKPIQTVSGRGDRGRQMPVGIQLPWEVEEVLALLKGQGQEAYAVGGCVRDSLLGRIPKDWDITTSALPEETKKAFSSRGYPVLETGIQHGTVTVLIDRMPIEVTTYRVDGSYSDHRRPEWVHFTRNLQEDLSRRDFTINAMAYNREDGIVDWFGGQEDCQRGILRCVGDPDQRFQEDALRLLRALRFSSSLGFELEPSTAEAVLRQKELLRAIAPERISKEFAGLLCGNDAGPVLRRFYPVAGVFLPELLPMAGYVQHNPHHIYDVLEHTLHALGHIEGTAVLRFAVLFHDIGKPLCFSRDEQGIGHFYGHASISARIAREALTRLRLDNATIDRVELLVKYHDVQIEHSPKSVKRWLNRISQEAFRQLLQVKAADNLAQRPDLSSRVEELRELSSLADRIIREGQCFCLKDLMVNGNDLIQAGMAPGKELGAALERLLERVMEGTLPNEKRALLEAARYEFNRKTPTKDE